MGGVFAAARISRAIICAPAISTLARGVTIDTTRRCAWRACRYPREWAEAIHARAQWHKAGGEANHVLRLTSGTKLVVEPPLADVRHVGDGWLSIRVVFGAELLDLLRAEGAELRSWPSVASEPVEPAADRGEP